MLIFPCGRKKTLLIENVSVRLRTVVADKGVYVLSMRSSLINKIAFQLFRTAVFSFKNLPPEVFVNIAFL